MSKKEFNPALDFLSKDTKKEAQPKKKKSAPPKKEVKSRRVQLVLKPSLYEKLSEQSWKERKSVNEFISELLEDRLR